MILRVQEKLGVSERRACTVVGQTRKTQRRTSSITDEEVRLAGHIIELATRYGRYGYRRIAAMLKNEGWQVNHKRGRTNLEEGRFEGAKEAAQERKAMVQRRFMYPATATA